MTLTPINTSDRAAKNIARAHRTVGYAKDDAGRGDKVCARSWISKGIRRNLHIQDDGWQQVDAILKAGRKDVNRIIRG